MTDPSERKVAAPAREIPRLPSFLRWLPAQFGFLSGLRIGLIDTLRRVIDPAAYLSYANAGEDLVLTRMFQGRPGHYVDVGCNHAQLHSNTFRLYKHGWRGITIDAVQALVEQHRRLRIRDIQVEAAVSSSEGTERFVLFSDDDQIGSLAQSRASYTDTRTDVREIEVRTRTLTGILDEHQMAAGFDLLSIDTEGHELAVLEALDFKRYRPRVIVIELLGVGDDVLGIVDQPVHRLLIGQGYRLVGYLIQNAYYADARSARIDELYFG